MLKNWISCASGPGIPIVCTGSIFYNMDVQTVFYDTVFGVSLRCQGYIRQLKLMGIPGSDPHKTNFLNLATSK